MELVIKNLSELYLLDYDDANYHCGLESFSIKKYLEGIKVVLECFIGEDEIIVFNNKKANKEVLFTTELKGYPYNDRRLRRQKWCSAHSTEEFINFLGMGFSFTSAIVNYELNFTGIKYFIVACEGAESNVLRIFNRNGEQFLDKVLPRLRVLPNRNLKVTDER